MALYGTAEYYEDIEHDIPNADWRVVARFTVEREMLELENELVQAKANAAISQQLQYIINGR